MSDLSIESMAKDIVNSVLERAQEMLAGLRTGIEPLPTPKASAASRTMALPFDPPKRRGRKPKNAVPVDGLLRRRPGRPPGAKNKAKLEPLPPIEEMSFQPKTDAERIEEIANDPTIE